MASPGLCRACSSTFTNECVKMGNVFSRMRNARSVLLHSDAPPLDHRSAVLWTTLLKASASGSMDAADADMASHTDGSNSCERSIMSDGQACRDTIPRQTFDAGTLLTREYGRHPI